MKKILLLIPLLLLASCGLTNEEIVNQTNYCKEQWYEAKRIINGLNQSIRSIQCIEFKWDEALSEIDRIQIQNCIYLWKQPRKSSWDWEYICNEIYK